METEEMKTKGRSRKTKVLTRKEGRKLLDQKAQEYLDISGEEFKRKWDAKEFTDPDRPEVMRVAFLLPFGR